MHDLVELFAQLGIQLRDQAVEEVLVNLLEGSLQLADRVDEHPQGRRDHGSFVCVGDMVNGDRGGRQRNVDLVQQDAQSALFRFGRLRGSLRGRRFFLFGHCLSPS